MPQMGYHRAFDASGIVHQYECLSLRLVSCESGLTDMGLGVVQSKARELLYTNTFVNRLAGLPCAVDISRMQPNFCQL